MKKKYKWGMLLLVCFLLGVGLAIPILTKKEPFESITPTEPMGDDPPEPFLYEEFIAPENSFGIGDTVFKTVNWTYFKQLFNAHCDWMLEYKHFESSSWTDGNQYMTIEKEWNETLRGWKFNLILDVPVDVYSARFTFGCDLPVLDYVEHDDWQVNLNYTVPGTNETYNCYFNWSDMAGVPNIVFNKGRTNDMFWFRFRRDNIPAGHYEFDPIFGDETAFGNDIDIDNAISGMRAIVAPSSGYCNNITVRVENWGAGQKIKCAIYEDNGDNTHSFLNSTDELTTGGHNVWITFPFSAPEPYITKGTEYMLVAWSEDIDAEINWGFGSPSLVVIDVWANVYASEWPTPYEETNDIVNSVSIYCSYTEYPTAPTFTEEIPANASYNVSLSPTVNVTITDANGNESTVDIYISTDGNSWTHAQQNVSVLNESVSYIYTGATEYQTTYYWKVYANDTVFNSSVTYSFETTPYRTNYFNDTFPNENWIDATHNMSIFETGWENFTYNDPTKKYAYTGMTPATYDINPNLDMYDSTYDYGPSPRCVFTDADTGYAVGIDTSNADEPHMYKTTDGGETWFDQGGIDTASDPTDGWAGAMWYDQWTPGDTTGTKIYLAYTGDNDDDIEFNYIDTSDDSYRGSWQIIFDGGIADGGDGSPAICKGTDGILWAGGFGSARKICNSSDGGNNWVNSTPGSLFNDDDDNMQLLPLPDGDILCVYHDISAGTIYSFRYWKGNATWSSANTIDTGLNTDMNNPFSCSMDISSNEIYMVDIDGELAASADITFFRYTPANNTWWGGIKLEENAYGFGASIVTHEDTGDLYAFHGDGASGLIDIYYQKSTNGGSTWSTREKISTVTDDNRHCLGNFMSNERIYATWVNDDLNDWHGNTLATYALGKTDAYLSSSTIYRQNTNWDKFYADVNDATHCSFALSDPNTHYNITTGLTGNGDDISSITNSSVYIYANFSDSSVNMGSWNISWSSDAENNAPTVDYKFPVNASTGISTTPRCQVYANDTDGDTLNVTWASNCSGSWVNYHTNVSIVANTEPSYTFSCMSDCNTKYWWKVYVNDGTENISETYHFTTKRAWQQITEGYLTFDTSDKTWNQITEGYLTFDTTGKSWQQTEEGYLEFETVLSTREFNQISKGYLNFVTSGRAYNQISTGYLEFETIGRTFNQLDIGYLDFSTGGKWHNQVETGWLSFETVLSTRAWNQMELGWLSYETSPCTRAFNQISTGHLDFETTGVSWEQISKGYLDFNTVGKSYNQISIGHLEFTTPGVDWNQVDTGFLTFETSGRSFNQISLGSLDFGTSGRNWNQVSLGYLDFDIVGRNWNQISTGWLSFVTSPCTRAFNQISKGSLDFETSPSTRAFNQISKGWLTFSVAGRDWNQLALGYLDFVTVGKGHNQIETGWLSYETSPSTRAFNQISTGYLDFTTPGIGWNQIDKGHLTFSISGRSYNQIDTGYLEFDTSGRAYNQVEKGWLSFGMVGKNWEQVTEGWLDFVTVPSTRAFNQVEMGYLEFVTAPSTRAFNQVETGYLDFDTVGRSWNQVETGYLEFDMTGRTFESIDTGWLSFTTPGVSWEQIDLGYLTFTTPSKSWNQVSQGWLTFGMTGSSWNQLSLGYLTFATQSVWGQVDTGYLTFTTPEKGEPGGGTEEPELPVPPFIRTTIETIISPQAILLWGAILFVLFLLVYSRREKKKYKRDIIIKHKRIKIATKKDAKHIDSRFDKLDNRIEEIAKSFKRK